MKKSPYPFEATYPVKKKHQFEDRFAIVNLYFDDPFITLVKKDAKISNIGKFVSFFLQFMQEIVFCKESKIIKEYLITIGRSL